MLVPMKHLSRKGIDNKIWGLESQEGYILEL